MCADAFTKKIIKISPCLLKLQLTKVGAFLKHSVEDIDKTVSHRCVQFVLCVL